MPAVQSACFGESASKFQRRFAGPSRRTAGAWPSDHDHRRLNLHGLLKGESQEKPEAGKPMRCAQKNRRETRPWGPDVLSIYNLGNVCFIDDLIHLDVQHVVVGEASHPVVVVRAREPEAGRTGRGM
jgi:hypothetical protein